VTSPQILALFILAGLVVQTGMLCHGVSVCRLPRRSVGRALIVVVVQFVLTVGGLAFGVLDGLDDPDWGGFSLALLSFVVQICVTVWLLKLLFGGRFWPRVGAWAIQTVGSILAGLVCVAILRQFVHTYQPQASSMNPNLRGFHVVEDLPDGNHLIVGVNPPWDTYLPPGATAGGLVAETFEYREVPRPRHHTHPADRVLCNRTRVPERWAAIVFRHPEDPAVVYVKRLVGLPGEKVEIRDGAVWINGERQSPPARLGPIRYTSGFVFGDEPPPPFERQLGPDEFFALGDNTERSSDSRVWGPVPRENIIGVADAIYWPPDRWRRDP
jgi:signal peptidase I